MGLALPQRLRQGVGDFPPPAEFADAVELYARKSGRSGKLKFVPPINCWIVELSLKANDPGLRGWQAGNAGDEPAEVVYLWRPPTAVEQAKGAGSYVGYKLDELGVTGLLELLDKTNTTTGRGQYASQVEAARDQAYKAEQAREKLTNERRENVRDMAEEYRRSINKIPLLGVGIALAPTTAPESQEK